MKDNFVKIPKDFESLHELTDFKNQYSAATNFIKKIDEYRNSYFNSFIKSYDDVLQYIPEKQLKSYHVSLLDKDLYRLDKFDIKDLKLNNKSRGVEIVNKVAKIVERDHTKISITDKVFLINTIDKKVQFCPWMFTHVNGPYLKAAINGNMFVLSYDDFKLKVVPGESKFRVAVQLYIKGVMQIEEYYKMEARLASFGMDANPFYHSRHNSYYEIHDFCLRTNRYLGYNKDKSEYYYDYNDGAFEF